MEKKLYNSPLTEVITLSTENLMNTGSISDIAPADPGATLAPSNPRQTPVF